MTMIPAMIPAIQPAIQLNKIGEDLNDKLSVITLHD